MISLKPQKEAGDIYNWLCNLMVRETWWPSGKRAGLAIEMSGFEFQLERNEATRNILWPSSFLGL